MYLDDLKNFCKSLHHLPTVEIKYVIQAKARELEEEQRRFGHAPARFDYVEYHWALRRLWQYVSEPGIPVGLTDEENEIFAEVVEKQISYLKTEPGSTPWNS